MKPATLQDVAKLAGVSTGTASKYINGIPISPKNQSKIASAIRVLNYTPSPLARNFASGKSYTILLYIIVESPIIASTWQYELPIFNGINDVLKDTMYSLKIEIAPVEDVEANSKKLDGYTRSKYADGIILLSPWEIGQRLTLPLDYHAFPYVVIGGESSTLNGCINFDNRQPIYEITTGMIDSGRQRLGMIGGFREHLHSAEREQGFRKALSERRIPVDERLIKYGNFSLQSGYSCTLEMLRESEPPNGIVCGNDYIAAGAIRAIKQSGFRVPEDIFVSGFDDTIVSEATDPTITTVRAPSSEMGAAAVLCLLKKLEDHEYAIPCHMLECEVVYKQSTQGKRLQGL